MTKRNFLAAVTLRGYKPKMFAFATEKDRSGFLKDVKKASPSARYATAKRYE